MNTFKFENVIEAPMSEVWNILQDPASVISEWNAKIEKISNEEWKEIESNDLYNTMHATFNENSVHITSINSKYPSESIDILLSLEKIDDASTKIKVHYNVKTGALFNKISLGLFGDKIAHHVDNVIVKNIKKKLK